MTRTKQVQNVNPPERLEIHLDAVDPFQLTEARILMMIICVYQSNNLEFDARTVAANAIGSTEQHLSHCISGSAKLGDEAWMKLLMLCGDKARVLRDIWLQELSRRYPVNDHD